MALLATGSNAEDAGIWAVLALASWQLRDRDEARRAAERALALSDGDVIMTARLRWLLARLALESLDTDRFRANLLQLEELERIARGADRAEVLTGLAELKMLSNDADEVMWGRRAVAAAVATPLEGRARLSLGSSLTNEPGRRGDGRAILADIIERRTCDSYHHARALNNLLCDAVYAWPAADVWPLIDQFERHVVATALSAVFAEMVASIAHNVRNVSATWRWHRQRWTGSVRSNLSRSRASHRWLPCSNSTQVESVRCAAESSPPRKLFDIAPTGRNSCGATRWRSKPHYASDQPRSRHSSSGCSTPTSFHTGS